MKSGLPAKNKMASKRVCLDSLFHIFVKPWAGSQRLKYVMGDKTLIQLQCNVYVLKHDPLYVHCAGIINGNIWYVHVRIYMYMNTSELPTCTHTYTNRAQNPTWVPSSHATQLVF